MELKELSITELKQINGGGKLANWLGYYGTAFIMTIMGYNNYEEGDYRVKSPYIK